MCIPRANSNRKVLVKVKDFSISIFMRNIHVYPIVLEHPIKYNINSISISISAA